MRLETIHDTIAGRRRWMQLWNAQQPGSDGRSVGVSTGSSRLLLKVRRTARHQNPTVEGTGTTAVVLYGIMYEIHQTNERRTCFLLGRGNISTTWALPVRTLYARRLLCDYSQAYMIRNRPIQTKQKCNLVFLGIVWARLQQMPAIRGHVSCWVESEAQMNQSGVYRLQGASRKLYPKRWVSEVWYAIMGMCLYTQTLMLMRMQLVLFNNLHVLLADAICADHLIQSLARDSRLDVDLPLGVFEHLVNHDDGHTN